MSDAITTIIREFADTGLAGHAVLTLAFLISGLTFVPRSAVCFAGGLFFGFESLPTVFLGTALGAVVPFLATRYVLRPRFERMLESRPRLRATARAVDMEGWRVVGLVRVGAPIPASVGNYLFGITGIGVVPYTVATVLGTAPQNLTFVYAGVVSRTAIVAVPISTAETVLLISGFVALSVGTWYLLRRIRRNAAAIIEEYETEAEPGRS